MVLWDLTKRGYLRLIGPIADWLVRRNVSPNIITTLGTLSSMTAGGIYAAGYIRIAGWWLGLTAVFDVLDGEVARRSGRTSVFGAFYDSTLDRVADGAVLGGLMMFFARNGVHHKIPPSMSTPMVAVILLGIIGSFLTSYTRARADGLGIDAKVGILQRPERITLLSAPQAFFGLAFGGWVLIAICGFISVTAWITAVQRILFVKRATEGFTESPMRAPARRMPPVASPTVETRPGAIERTGQAVDPMNLRPADALPADALPADVAPVGDPRQPGDAPLGMPSRDESASSQTHVAR
jgi:CDP-diacylglycerol--glycerol-3-phosphate 3-phosphatidyltransferase